MIGPPTAAPGLPTILVVDDNPTILDALQTILRGAGHRVFATREPLVGLKYLSASTVSVVIADQRMDAMTGLELLARARQLQPNASRILITGLLSVKTLVEAVNCGEIYRFVAKPWSTPELLTTMQNAVQRFQLLEENAALHAATSQLNAKLVAANRQLEARVAELATQRSAFDTMRDGLEAGRASLFDFCDTLLATLDPGLAARTRLTVDLCDRLACAGHLPENQRQILIASAWFHDTGFFAYSRDFVRSCVTGNLAANEETGASLRLHPIHSERLALAAGLGQAIGTAVRAHHECYDGSGYPDRLAGDQIPEMARWLTPVAYFVASGLSRELAIEEIDALSGIAFDPQVVADFLKIALHFPSPATIAHQLTPAADAELTALRRLYSAQEKLAVIA